MLCAYVRVVSAYQRVFMGKIIYLLGSDFENDLIAAFRAKNGAFIFDAKYAVMISPVDFCRAQSMGD